MMKEEPVRSWSVLPDETHEVANVKSDHVGFWKRNLIMKFATNEGM